MRELTWIEPVCQIFGHWVSSFGSYQRFGSFLFLVGLFEHLCKQCVTGTWRATSSIVPQAMANCTHLRGTLQELLQVHAPLGQYLGKKL